MTEDDPRWIVLGLDHGLKGAIAVICDGKARVVAIRPSPERRLPHRLDGGHSFVTSLKASGGARVVAALEDGIAMLQQSSRSTATAFRGIAVWHGILDALGISFEYAEAQSVDEGTSASPMHRRVNTLWRRSSCSPSLPSPRTSSQVKTDGHRRATHC